MASRYITRLTCQQFNIWTWLLEHGQLHTWEDLDAATSNDGSRLAASMDFRWNLATPSCVTCERSSSTSPTAAGW